MLPVFFWRSNVDHLKKSIYHIIYISYIIQIIYIYFTFYLLYETNLWKDFSMTFPYFSIDDHVTKPICDMSPLLASSSRFQEWTQMQYRKHRANSELLHDFLSKVCCLHSMLACVTCIACSSATFKARPHPTQAMWIPGCRIRMSPNILSSWVIFLHFFTWISTEKTVYQDSFEGA